MNRSRFDHHEVQAGMGAFAPEKRGFVVVPSNWAIFTNPRRYWLRPISPHRPIDFHPHAHRRTHTRTRIRVCEIYKHHWTVWTDWTELVTARLFNFCQQGKPVNKPEKITKEWVRTRFPASVAAADHFRAVFGEQVELKAADEGGRQLGAFTDESKYTVITGKDLLLSGRSVK